MGEGRESVGEERERVGEGRREGGNRNGEREERREVRHGQYSQWSQSWSHGLSVEGLHLEHEVSIFRVVSSLGEKVCEILTVD